MRRNRCYILSLIIIITVVVATVGYYYYKQNEQTVYHGTFVKNIEDLIT